MGESGDRHYQKLPPGWDCKYDQATGNCYYINYITKVMQLHDPRYRTLQNERCSSESIAMQSLHGSGGSPYHVYPSNNMTAIRAFQTPNSSLQHMSTSPLLTSSRTHLINDMSPLPVQKSQIQQAPRTVNLSRRSTIQETSFTNQIDTDAVVRKIQNMFPTASENHIRLLLKKYYNREAVVISALQVEKHPVTMPGPHVTPPGQRHLFHSNSTIHMTPPARRFDPGSHLRGLEMGNSYSRTASPVPPGRLCNAMSINSGNIGPLVLSPFHGSPFLGEQVRNSPKPHSSPKMKLRYMKMIFPKADETLLLDVLANADNNVQKASEKVISLGYTKKDFLPTQKPPQHFENQHEFDDGCHTVQNVTTIPLLPNKYTEDKKIAITQRLQKKYPHIVEHVIRMALESVNYVEDRAIQILQIVHDEEQERAMNRICPSHGLIGVDNTTTSNIYARDSVGIPRVSGHSHRDCIDSTEENLCKEFKSLMGRIQTNGPNSSLAKGADEGLLLADYVTWNGANPEFYKGQNNLAIGPDASLLSEHKYKPFGPNPELCKGPQVTLAKGSIYNQKNANNTKAMNIKCN
ncbi:uncharacterized protein LOC133327750 [Musca vetustissima]|uniref:uncharacterized protein LOC133327750 n=1 Tax=Musca vetustissima TaxID=27455 RepID=UPI002AB6661C|nr:uncharacterized protein LOC133327750 [Musca vetustissima]